MEVALRARTILNALNGAKRLNGLNDLNGLEYHFELLNLEPLNGRSSITL